MTAIVGAVILRRAFADYVFEDAYITYRYARSLASGAGFTFTPGERVLGTTTPLYTLLLSVLGRLGLEVHECGSVLYAAGLGAIGVVGGGILRHLGLPNSGILFALLVMTGFGTMSHFWGMETPHFIALLLGSGLAAMKGRDVLAAVLVALAFLTRYDAAPFAILLYVWLALLRGRVPWRSGLTACGIIAPWLIFAALYFGGVMPNTLGAKAGSSGFFEYLIGSLRAQLDHAWLFYLGGGVHAVRGNGYLIALDIAVGALALFAAVRHRRREPLLVLFLAYALVLWLVYALIGPPVTFRWYLKPAVFGLALLAMAGVGELLGRLPYPKAHGLAAIAASVAGLTWLSRTAPAYAENQINGWAYQSRVGAYQNMADWISQHGLQDLALMAREPGYLTYSTGNPAIDAAGLVTKGIRFHGSRDVVTPWSVLLETYRPELVVDASRTDGYVLVNSPFSPSQLFMRADEHALRFLDLAEEFGRLATTAPLPTGHPVRFDVGRASRDQWRELGGELVGIGAPLGLVSDGERVRDHYLYLRDSKRMAQTPPFLIDFDRLSFLFAATDASRTAARLVIDGRVVLEEGGHSDPSGGEFNRISWPVRCWRGRVAQVRFLGDFNQWLAADHIHSHRDPDPEVFDDFEEGDGYGDRWASTFPALPTPLDQLARDRGVEFMFSKRAALSTGTPGVQALTSKPFEVSHDAMSFLWFDDGTEANSIELTVGGEVVLSVRGTRGRCMRGTTWDLAPYRGRLAVLRIVDADERPQSGIGIDEILLFDRSDR